MIDPQPLMALGKEQESSVMRFGCHGSEVTPETLKQQNAAFCGTGGVSGNNQAAGFQSAFLDQATGCIYPSCYSNGQPAPMHLLDGLPDELVLQKDTAGRAVAVKQTVVAGFLLAGLFYTREQAAQLVAS
ncbi:MAG: hypothetical protein V2J55_08045 [Candidatus Competibacteraceae bacterium]|jgi:hypothetical protein|nr:hypothetical protein [Candidatus Competibacteraceae bacterium]